MLLYAAYLLSNITSMSNESSPYEVSESAKHPAASPNTPPAMPSKVAKVFGIIHIIYASLGMLNALVAVVGMAALKLLINQFGGKAKELDQIMKAYEGMMSYAYADMALKLVLGVVLISAGIGLLKKKKWALKVSLAWAVVRMVAAVAMIFIMDAPTKVFQEKMSEVGGAAGGAQMEKFQRIASGVGNLLGLVIICVYPILCLIFLSKKSTQQGFS